MNTEDVAAISTALGSGDFRAVINALVVDDRIEAVYPCPCGISNQVIITRTGCVVILWTDAADKHNNDIDTLIVVSHRSVSVAMQEMDAHRAEVAQSNGMAQLAAAMNGGQPVGDFMVI